MLEIAQKILKLYNTIKYLQAKFRMNWVFLCVEHRMHNIQRGMTQKVE